MQKSIPAKEACYFFISDFLQDLVETADTLPSVQSDHSTLKLKFSPINEWSRGPSSWKFNNSLTTDKCFVDSMESNIPTFYEAKRPCNLLGISRIQNPTVYDQLFQREGIRKESEMNCFRENSEKIRDLVIN